MSSNRFYDLAKVGARVQNGRVYRIEDAIDFSFFHDVNVPPQLNTDEEAWEAARRIGLNVDEQGYLLV
jgi:hypothetical protein